MNRLLIVFLTLSLVFSGCFLFGEEQVENVTENVTPPPPPPPPVPVVSITSPGTGETVTVPAGGGDVTLILSTQNLLLKPPGGLQKVGEGHFKLFVDGAETETFNSKIYSISGLAVGEHTVGVELVHNDGASYVPRIYKDVIFTVEEEAPDVYVPQEYEVTIKDFEYQPASITVKQTDSVTWVNKGSFPRSATCFLGGKEVFNTGVLGPGQSKTLTFSDLLECEYYSTTHPIMKANIKVESNGME